LFRRNAVYITAILLGCSFGVQAYDAAFDAAWEFNNKGVSERAKAEQQEQQEQLVPRLRLPRRAPCGSRRTACG
jgi:hypothetical protein